MIKLLGLKIKNVVLLIASLCAPVAAMAQVDAQFTQYWALPTYYNPGAVGNSDYIKVTAGSRLQWTGIPKAPQSFVALADSPFKLMGKRIGAGVVVMQESMGLYTSLNASAQVAYKLKFMKGELSIGVQAGLLSETFKGSEVNNPSDDTYHEGNDDGIPTTDITGSALDVNAGIFYTHKKFWASLSATHLTQASVTLKSDTEEEKLYEFKAGRTYYFMAGGNIPVKNTLFEIQPSVMVKSDMTFFAAEATARVRYNKFLSGGVGYRYNDAVSVMIGAEYKNFFLGYSYDYPLSAISKVSNGSHEVFLRYNVKLNLADKNKNKHKSIRIM